MSGMPAITMEWKLFIDPDDTDRSRRCLLALMHAMVFANTTYLQRFPATPPLYKSGVIYQPENGTENWQDIARTLELGYGDCEDLACYRCAELNFAGIRAHPYIKWREAGPKVHTYHALLQWPDGRIEDPSLALGMGGGPVIARPIFVDPGPIP